MYNDVWGCAEILPGAVRKFYRLFNSSYQRPTTRLLLLPLGRAWKTIETVLSTHRDFDGQFYRKKVRTIHG